MANYDHLRLSVHDVDDDTLVIILAKTAESKHWLVSPCVIFDEQTRALMEMDVCKLITLLQNKSKPILPIIHSVSNAIYSL